VSGELRLDADVASLAHVRRHMRRRLAVLGADDPCVHDLVQAVDEWVTNVIRHGYRGERGPVTVAVERVGDDAVVTIRDAAPDFDPATAPPFDPSSPIASRRPGGMGIHLMHELTDGMVHRALPGGGNELTIRRALRAGTPAAATGGDA
jgi:serine/threonine-protein kinase RsbW